MTIRPTPDLSQAAPVEGVRSDRAAAQGAGGRPSPATPAPSGDRVELSAGAQARAAQASPQSPEVEAARVALRAGSELGEARLYELRQRAQTGYYDRPEVVDRIAGAAARDLGRAE